MKRCPICKVPYSNPGGFCENISEHWRHLKPDDIVTVKSAISEMEKTLIGRQFHVVRWTKPSPEGYVVVADDWGNWRVHPESLHLDLRPS